MVYCHAPDYLSNCWSRCYCNSIIYFYRIGKWSISMVLPFLFAEVINEHFIWIETSNGPFYVVFVLENWITHIFLLGFEHLIRKQMLDAFPNKIANIHPSLFPSFLATKTAIQDALDYGVKVTGITTHIIDDRFDRGTILCQEPVRIDEGDTFDTLYPKFSSKGLPLIIESMKLMENQN